MQDEIILTALKEAVEALRSGKPGGRKIRIGAAHIRSARQKLRMTQEEFADKLGVSVQSVRSWEQGVRKPGILSQVMLGSILSKAKRLEQA
jgi:putative transcriptional regulator